ncbi:putative phenol monooxygenase [Aureobasidium subglaciale]|nr:putative phenol monooxygenase [Aureobasidium subglaciale]
MPVFEETATAHRDLRILPSRALPLPRLSPKVSTTGKEREVVVIGAGPSGLFLTLLLARYGISGSSLLCLDSKPGTLKAGQADGLQPRTLEVLQSLGIASEIIADGCHMEEVAFWNPIAQVEGANGNSKGGIERTSFVPDVNVPARFPFEVTIHQGRIERILQENLDVYAPKDTIRRSHHFLNYTVDTVNHPDYPILVNYEHEHEDGSRVPGSVRTKYLVGGDGAHSKVRKSMGLSLEGETSDHIWGVCDFVADTDFPDIRNRSAVHSESGSIMVIPREQIATGDFLTRLYVQVPGDVDAKADRTTTPEDEKKNSSKKKRAEVTLDYIFQQANAVFAPYSIKIKEGTAPDWYAAYQIGQRMSSKFSSRTPDGVDRVFIVGDACHTHSPKAGQGMNVSMMDSYNLSWKLAHSILGLSPQSEKKADQVLETFDLERVDTARQLIEFDAKFSHMFSGKIGSGKSEAGLTHDEFLKVFRDGSGFTSGCGLEYKSNKLVKSAKESEDMLAAEGDPLYGALTAGRRFLNVELKRYADNTTRQLHDELPSNGRYRILLLTSTNLLNIDGLSQKALKACATMVDEHPAGSIDYAVLHPIKERFEWTQLPSEVKRLAEMRTYGLGRREDAYETYGVAKDEGAIAVIRPDGYVGVLCRLSAIKTVQSYLEACLVET